MAFELHRSFYASEVIRDGESLGTYTAAISTGIRHLELIRYTSLEQFRTGEAFFRFYGKLKNEEFWEMEEMVEDFSFISHFILYLCTR